MSNTISQSSVNVLVRLSPRRVGRASLSCIQGVGIGRSFLIGDLIVDAGLDAGKNLLTFRCNSRLTDGVSGDDSPAPLPLALPASVPCRSADDRDLSGPRRRALSRVVLIDRESESPYVLLISARNTISACSTWEGLSFPPRFNGCTWQLQERNLHFMGGSSEKPQPQLSARR